MANNIIIPIRLRNKMPVLDNLFTFRFALLKQLFVKFKLLLMLGLIIANTTACQEQPENIIIISVDALNRSALKIYDRQAPDLHTLDLLADQSVIFAHAYSSASWTLPAFGSLFTGSYPDRHGAVHQHLRLSDSISNLTEKLKYSGFDTVAFTDGGYVSRAFGFGRGFDRYDDWVNPSVPWRGPTLPRNGKHNYLKGLTLFDRGIAFINGRKKNSNRFFLFLHTYVVHDYFLWHPWVSDRLRSYPDKGSRHYLACITGRKSCPQEDWDRLRSLYRAELYRLDEGIDRLLAALDKQGLRKSTLILFISDHGEGFDPDRGRIHHGGRLHQDLIRIPLFISGPGIEPRISKTPISIVDIMPTLLDLCDIDIPPGVDGRSFAHILQGEEDDSLHPVYAMEHFHWWNDGRRFDLPFPQGKPISIAVISEEDWYIRSGKNIEIYDMRNDPLQHNDLSCKSPLKSKLERLVEIRNIYKPSAPAAIPDRDTLNQLRSLGYID